MHKASKSAHNLKLCLSFRGAERRGNPFFLRRQYVFMRRKGDADCHDRCAHRSRNDRGGSIPCLFFYLMAVSVLWRPLRRLMAASSPSRGAKRMRHIYIAPVRNLCRGALPLLGEVPSAHTGERGRRWAETAIRQKKERGNDRGTAQRPSPTMAFSVRNTSNTPPTCVYPPFRKLRMGDNEGIKDVTKSGAAQIIRRGNARSRGSGTSPDHRRCRFCHNNP